MQETNSLKLPKRCSELLGVTSPLWMFTNTLKNGIWVSYLFITNTPSLNLSGSVVGQLRGFQIKPYALLFAPFEVIVTIVDSIYGCGDIRMSRKRCWSIVTSFSLSLPKYYLKTRDTKLTVGSISFHLLTEWARSQKKLTRAVFCIHVGTLFFTDRTRIVANYLPSPDWFDMNMPFPLSKTTKNLRWMKFKTSFEMESGKKWTLLW